MRQNLVAAPHGVTDSKHSLCLAICFAEYLELAHDLGMDALVEAHDEEEVSRALASGAGIIGVNNRDLRTFQVDISTSIRLRDMVPPDRIYVSESGIRDARDIEALRRNCVDAVLIGEAFMRSPDKKEMLRLLTAGDRCR